MRRKLWIILAAAVVLVSVGVLVVRFQPRGSVSIFRSGAKITARASSIFARPLSYETLCRASAAPGGVAYSDGSSVRDADGDEFVIDVRATYTPPDHVAGSWSQGSWCDSLRATVRDRLMRWAGGVRSASVLSDRREVAHTAADMLQRDLRALGVNTTNLRATITLPEGFDRARTVPEVASLAARKRPVIFIGLDGADWELLDDYMAAGTMPVLQRLVREGSGGVLETEHPPLSPLLWNTMFTGVGPLEHQILDFTRFNPYSHAREPITSDERRVPAIWNMATMAGKKTAVFGVWATYAAEPLHGLNVSDRLFTFLFSESSIPRGAVYPGTRSEWARGELAAAESSVTAARLRDYLPWLSDADYEQAAHAENPYSQPPSALRRILVETEVYRRLASSYLSSDTLPDLSIIYIQGTDTVGHVFAPFAPPRQPQIDADAFGKYSQVPQRYFTEVDRLLGEFVALAQRNGADIVIASDHGFRWKEGRPLQLSSFAAASAAKWHRTEGIFLLWGPGIAASPGHPLHGGVRQLCATLAGLTGLPQPAQTQVAALPGVQPSASKLDYARYFQRAAPPPPPASPAEGGEDVAKLRALGYIGSTEASENALASSDTKTAGAFNNAGLIQRQQKNIPAAIASFEHALTIDPKLASAQWNLSETLFDSQQQLDRADELLAAALGNGLPDGARFLVARAIGYQRSGHLDRALHLLDAGISVAPQEAELRMFRGRYRLDRQDCSGALEDFSAAVATRPDAIAFASRGLAQMCLGDVAGTRESFSRSLQLDPNQPMLQRFLAGQ